MKAVDMIVHGMLVHDKNNKKKELIMMGVVATMTMVMAGWRWRKDIVLATISS